MSWFVLKVKARNEKRVAETLLRMNVEVFSPTIKEVVQWSDRKKENENPLFKSYVFVKIEEKYRGIVFAVTGVERYLFWMGKPAVVRDAEIEIIKQWMSEGSNDLESLSKLIPGSEITIEKGVFKDQEAVVHRVDKSKISFLLKEMGVVAQANIAEVV